MAWWAWGIVANLAITVIEYLNRTQGFATPLHAFRTTGVFVILAQVGLFYSWRDAPTLMMAWATYALGSTALRLASVTWAVGEVPSLTVLLGAGLMVGGFYCIKIGS